MPKCTVRGERELVDYNVEAQVFKGRNIIAILKENVKDESCVVTIAEGYTYEGLLNTVVRKESYCTIKSGKIVQVIEI